MRWSNRPAAAKAVAASSVLAVAFLGIVALDPVSSQTEGKTLAVFTMDGPGAQFATIYELRDDGVLISTRRAVGGGVEQRQLVLAPIDKDRYLDLLETGGYLTEAPQNLQLPGVQSKLGAVVDVPDWRIRVHRSPSEIVSVKVPAPVVGELYPSLNDVPYVAVAWQLIEEFENRWDSSEQVQP